MKENKNIQITHNFIYNDHQYPFDFDLLSLSSQYLSKNQGLKNNKNIKILPNDENTITLTEDSILTFIQACQNQPFKLTRSNVVGLNFLSIKYEVQSLIQKTNKFISNNSNDFLIQFLIQVQNENYISIESDEQYIADQLTRFLKDDIFLLIPVFSMYRIINKHENKNSPELIEFLFKYLDVQGKKASVLFSNIDFGTDQTIYLRRLMKKNSTNFDFEFINSKNLKELIEKEEIRINQQRKNDDGIKSITKFIFIAFLLFFTFEILFFVKENQNIRDSKDAKSKEMLSNFTSSIINEIGKINLNNEILMNNILTKINIIEQMFHNFTTKIENEKTMKFIKLLYVRSNESKSINLDFINRLNHDSKNKEYFIQYATLYGSNIPINYFDKFDVIVIGGTDAYAYKQDSISLDTIRNLKNFHNLNGTILFLHDVVYLKLVDPLSSFTNFLGYKKQHDKLLDLFTKVHFNEKIGNTNLLSTPFSIPKTFEVAPTHISSQYDHKYSIFLNPSNDCYYAENLDEHFADCTMGHSPDITNDEQKFFYNVICHLYLNSLNHHILTNI